MRRSPAKTEQPPPPPAVDLLLDLQDIDFSTPAPPPLDLAATTTSNAPPQATSGLMAPLAASSGLMAPTSASSGLMANLEVRPPQATPTPAQDNLLDMLDGPTAQTTPTKAPPTTTTSANLELSTLDSALPAPMQSQGALALTLFETPVGSVRVPQEYLQYPVAKDCENKVRVHYRVSPPLYSSLLVGSQGVTTIHRSHCIIRPPLYSSPLVGSQGMTTIHRFHCTIRPPLYSSLLVG